MDPKGKHGPKRTAGYYSLPRTEVCGMVAQARSEAERARQYTCTYRAACWPAQERRTARRRQRCFTSFSKAGRTPRATR